MASQEKPVAIVTGAAKGIGRATSEVLLKNSYRVCLADVDEETCVATRTDLAAKFGENDVIYVHCDVTIASDLTNTFETTLKAFNRVDVLINNAGTVNEDQWENTIALNLNGVIHGCHAALKYMGRQNGGKGGDVINIASSVGLMVLPIFPVYVATKHAVVGLTRAYGDPLYFDKDGVRFNAICPSGVKTDLLAQCQRLRGVKEGPAVMDPEYVGGAIMKVLEDKLNGHCLLVTIKGGYQYVGLPEIMKTVSLT